MAEALIRSIRLDGALVHAKRNDYPWTLPAVSALTSGLTLDSRVTYLIGENGVGKSTLMEAIAVAADMNAEGGSRNFAYATRASHSELGQALRLVRGARRPRTEFFLRAESFFTAATYLDELQRESPEKALAAYGGRSLHEQSHGESFLALLMNRFGPDGLYLLDEPEAALSPQNCLTLLRRIHELTERGSQFVIATHSPLVLAYPNATIVSCDANGLDVVSYDEAEPVRLTQAFLSAPDRFLDRLLSE